jgi:hypothetical protein
VHWPLRGPANHRQCPLPLLPFLVCFKAQMRALCLSLSLTSRSPLPQRATMPPHGVGPQVNNSTTAFLTGTTDVICLRSLLFQGLPLSARLRLYSRPFNLPPLLYPRVFGPLVSLPGGLSPLTHLTSYLSLFELTSAVTSMLTNWSPLRGRHTSVSLSNLSSVFGCLGQPYLFQG